MKGFTGSFTADGSGVPFDPMIRHAPSGFRTLYGGGGFGAGTLQLEVSPDDGTTWFPAVDAVTGDDIKLAAVGLVNFQIKATLARLTLAGSTTPTITWWVL